MVEALRFFGARRISVATPYPEWNNRQLRAYLEALGFDVLNVDGEPSAAASGNQGINDHDPEEVDQPDDGRFRELVRLLAKAIARLLGEGERVGHVADVLHEQQVAEVLEELACELRAALATARTPSRDGRSPTPASSRRSTPAARAGAAPGTASPARPRVPHRIVAGSASSSPSRGAARARGSSG